MRSEHNGGASLAAFLLAVSTLTLLMVSPVEGQGTPCTTDAACTDPSQPFCDVPEGATGGLCGECVVSAFPDESGSCPDSPPQLCGRSLGTIPDTVCLGCASVTSFYGITSAPEREILATRPDLNQDADVVANCQRECFDFYACATNADCPGTLPFCDAGGECRLECIASADCPADRPSCEAGLCFECGTDADCPANSPLCVVRECFECGTNADCPADRNICDAGQCFAEPGCGTNADCPDTLPFCDIECVLISQNDVVCETAGQCVATDPSECAVSAFPGEDGSCPDAPEGEGFAGPQICGRTVSTIPKTGCTACAEFEQVADLTTLADCEILATSFNQTADVVANCQRECFGFYACATNADCPDTLPICNAGQCEISVFSPLDGMGGGSSA